MANFKQNNKQVSLEDFSYKAIHDLKAPIRGIDSFMKLLVKKNKDNWDEKDEKYINFVFKSASKMQNLVQDLLNFMKVADQEHETEEIHLENLVNGIFESLAEHNQNATLTSSNLPTVKGVKLLYEILFTNLITNAITYVEKGAAVKVSVTCKASETAYIYCIEDNGIGIAEDDLSSIFSPLERLHSDSVYPGTGLGLAICSRIVNLLDGSITVTSVENVGSTFTVTIPKM